MLLLQHPKTTTSVATVGCLVLTAAAGSMTRAGPAFGCVDGCDASWLSSQARVAQPRTSAPHRCTPAVIRGADAHVDSAHGLGIFCASTLRFDAALLLVSRTFLHPCRFCQTANLLFTARVLRGGAADYNFLLPF